MKHSDVLEMLGLQQGVTPGEIEKAITIRKGELESKMASAPTDALKAKFQTMLDKVTAAEESLTSSAKTASPLSQTKMADLPGMAPVADNATQQIIETGVVLAGRYEIKELIGQGGMGSVYRAHDTNRNEDIAIKMLLPSLLKNEQARERFLSEAKISSSLAHPNIVNVFDVQHDGDQFFLTMELLEGQDLRSLMESRKMARQVFTEEQIKDILNPISDALSYAHDYTLHRDIKPENIWVTESGQYKLMDFGIARVMSNSQMTQTGAAMGTAYYMAPEQLAGRKDIDGRADQYALAVMAYELLTGNIPAGVIKPLKESRKDISKGFANLIMTALSGQAEDRFTDMKLFSEALNKKGGGIPALPIKTISIAAGIILSLGVVSSLISSGSLSGLLPESAEVLQAKKAAVYKLQGEIKSLKRRLENSRRDLKDKLSEAKRDKRTKQQRHLENWLNLTTRHVFESPRITDLQGNEAVGEGMLRDKDYATALPELTKVKQGYQFLLDTFDVSERTLQLKQNGLPKAKKQWENTKRKYDLSNPNEITQAEQSATAATKAYREGELIKANNGYQTAMNHYAQAEKAESSLKQIKAKKLAWQKSKDNAKLTGKLVRIPAGSFSMGSNKYNSEKPIHTVRIKSFKMMANEVTFNQYDAYARATGKARPKDGGWGRGNRPVINVNWHDANGFAKWVSKKRVNGSDSPAKPSGNMPPVVAVAVRIAGVTPLVQAEQIVMVVVANGINQKQPPLLHFARTNTVFMICMEMFGNGRKIVGVKVTTEHR